MSDPYAAAVSGAAGRSLQLDQVLSTLLHQAPDVEAAAVVSFDGLPMASALPAGMDEDRVAAMSAALLSLGERAAQGLGRGDLSQVYVEGDNGTVFLVSADDEAVLVAVGRVGAKVGLMLFEVKQAAEAVGATLRVDAAPVEPLVPAVAPVVTPVVAPVEPVRSEQPEPVAPPAAASSTEAETQPEVVQPVVAQPVVAQPVVAPPVSPQEQPVPTVAPDPPAAAQQREPVAVPVPREVRDASWDHSSTNGSDPHGEQRRTTTVGPDGSSW